EEPAQQHEQGQDRRLDAERRAQLLHRKGRVRVDALVAGLAHARGRCDQRARAVELGEQTPDRRPLHQYPSLALTQYPLLALTNILRSRSRVSFARAHAGSFTSASGRLVRISKIEIMGMKRMKRKKSVAKRPSVPTKVATSQMVG